MAVKAVSLNFGEVRYVAEMRRPVEVSRPAGTSCGAADGSSAEGRVVIHIVDVKYPEERLSPCG